MRAPAEAVQYLRERGYVAYERNWALGQTIAVLIGRSHKVKIGGHPITMWDEILYLYPHERGWAVDDVLSSNSDYRIYSSLLEAVQAVEEIAWGANREEQ